jgi:hypothetical protein
MTIIQHRINKNHVWNETRSTKPAEYNQISCLYDAVTQHAGVCRSKICAEWCDESCSRSSSSSKPRPKNILANPTHPVIDFQHLCWFKKYFIDQKSLK